MRWEVPLCRFARIRNPMRKRKLRQALAAANDQIRITANGNPSIDEQITNWATVIVESDEEDEKGEEAIMVKRARRVRKGRLSIKYCLVYT